MNLVLYFENELVKEILSERVEYKNKKIVKMSFQNFSSG